MSFGRYAVSILLFEKITAFSEKKIEYLKVQIQPDNEIPHRKKGGHKIVHAQRPDRYGKICKARELTNLVLLVIFEPLTSRRSRCAGKTSRRLISCRYFLRHKPSNIQIVWPSRPRKAIFLPATP